MSPGFRAAIEPTVTMVPPPCSIMLGSTAWVRAKTPVRLTFITASHSSSGTQRALRALLEWPALLIKMSTRPCSLTTHSARARPWGGLATSASRATAWPPAFLISATTASRGGRRRPVTTTCAPSAASISAVERPMPVPPPVTIATFPSSFPILLLSPRPHGLFEVVHARRAAVADNLTHLVDDGGRGRVDEAAEDGELDDRPVGLRNADEARHAGSVENL